ncbi:AAA family ATPase [Heliorestis acidaminivorans]|uniref:AAA family ATPase n=1 Tax=Heliorestis acidaminivorans TaxID=553427 RepID=A0A6I0EZB0_9FIRM|nr:AAA family ATPase [Heliorestis acidaminivorans]
MKVLLATGVKQIDNVVSLFTGLETVWVGYRESVVLMAKKESVNVVILSAFLPGSEEIECIITSLRLEEIRVILLAGSIAYDAPLVTEAIRCGVYDVLYNPITPSKLKQAMESPATYRDAMLRLEKETDNTVKDGGDRDRNDNRQKEICLSDFQEQSKASSKKKDTSESPSEKEEVDSENYALRTLNGTTLAKEVIVIASPKGGTGKTVMAVNLAAVIYKITKQRVALIDLDLPWGNVAAQLQLSFDEDFFLLESLPEVIRENVLLELMQKHSSGIYVLANLTGLSDEKFIDSNGIKKILFNLPRFFDYVVVDTGSNLQIHTTEAIRYATKLICMNGFDTATLHNTRKWLTQLKVRELIGDFNDVGQVFNRITGKEGIDISDAEDFLQSKAYGAVHWKPDIQRIINQGKIPALVDSSFGDEIERIARRLFTQVEMSNGILDRLKKLVSR